MKIKRKISDHFRDNRNKLFLEGTADEEDGRMALENGNCDEAKWHFSQVKGTFDDDETDADLISCVEFNSTGDLLATGDKSGRIVIFQKKLRPLTTRETLATAGCSDPPRKKYDYRVYSTFQSHEAEFDYLKSLEIEEKINRIRWLKRRNFSHFLLSTNDKTIKLWKISERDKQMDGSSLIGGSGGGRVTSTPSSQSFNGNGTIGSTARTSDSADFHYPDNDRMDVDAVHVPPEYNFNAHQLKVPSIKPMDLVIEASPRRIFSNAHTYHINSISVNSDQETYLSADDLRINLWHLDITDQSFNIVDIKPKNMEELTEVITVAEFHPTQCNLFVYSSSKGTIRLCDMRAAALCDRHAKLFEETDDDSQRCYFSEIISSISDVKFSHSGRYMISRDYLTVKVWDLHMESRPIETYKVHEFLYPNLCALYENDCIFDKFECCWSPNDNEILTGSYNNFFRLFDRNQKRDLTLEASKNNTKENVALKPRKVCLAGKRKKDEISVDCFDFTKKILHSTWHPTENIVAIAATNNLFIFEKRW